MTEKLSQKMSSWLVWRPLKFSILSLGLMALTTFVFNFITIGWLKKAAPGPVTTTIVLGCAALVATIIYIWRLPRENYDRRSFVALNTAQMFVLGMAFLISSIIIMMYSQSIMNGMWMMHMYFNPYFTALMLGLAVFYMYLMGLGLTNIYVKYRRARAMGVSPMRAIFSMPFGFAMLWIAGYVLPGAKEKTSIVPIRAKWYNKLTDAIMATPLRGTIALAILIIISAALFQDVSTIVTLGMGLIFAIFWRVMGTEKLRQNIPGKYAVSAIIMNIIAFVTLIFISVKSESAPSDIQINIQDVTPIEQAQ